MKAHSSPNVIADRDANPPLPLPYDSVAARTLLASPETRRRVPHYVRTRQSHPLLKAENSRYVVLSAAGGGAVAEIFFVANSARVRRGLAGGWFSMLFSLSSTTFFPGVLS